MAYIYKITNKINNKCYIGKTLKTIEERWKEHCKAYLRRSKEKRPLYSAMKKYGIENFKVEEIEQCSENIVNEREKYWIEYYSSFKNGYNATLGGDGKAYIDRDLVVSIYNKLQNITETAKQLNIHPDSVHNILKDKQIQIKSNGDIAKEKLGKIVHMYSKNENYIQSFPTMRDAGRYLIENKLTNCKLTTIRQHISEVCRGIRKTAAGFKWKTD